MSTASHVPETSRFNQDELSADDARATLTHVGIGRLVTDSFRRMRYGDGFTATRALAFQFVLSLIPLLIAFVGLASMIKAEKLAQALRQTILSVTPGGKSDAFKQVLTRGLAEGGAGSRIALGIGPPQRIIAIAHRTRRAASRHRTAAARYHGLARCRDRATRQSRRACAAARVTPRAPHELVDGRGVGDRAGPDECAVWGAAECDARPR